ncbi:MULTISPECIES: acetyltransferase [unclassified Flavobacterium]|uniref:acetyltransferase n=1 Tax=unclassified Flavobacterium TaxID=196869 RepID=UPI00086DB024|nr:MULTISPECIES: acetyltransferase [unclassified Flavobacterium]MBN9285019.1 acetyltransferase [Flavobacterium sp.]ODS81379.1 MAG: acetyltransferase [Chryseobacterium sp. SCN 40-13]OJV69872.1 MAG: acetyltransferase [Flavobacterium sp. 40-81]
MKNIAIIGAGGFGREVKMLIDDINSRGAKYNFIGFYDDGLEKGTVVNNHIVLGGIDDLNKTDKKLCVALGIGDPNLKSKIISRITNPDIEFPEMIHPSVLIGKDEVSIGKGTIICAGTIITCNILIKEFVTLNLMCTVGHDTQIGSFASFMPSVNISGEVKIEDKVYVGTGAKIINQLEIGTGTIIGAGAVVSKSLPAKCTAVGIPAKPIKFHE